MKTIEEKRAFLHDHYLVNADEQKALAVECLAGARKAATMEAWFRHRATLLGDLDDATVDLLIEDWTAALELECAAQMRYEAHNRSNASLEAFLSPNAVYRFTRPRGPLDEYGWNAQITEGETSVFAAEIPAKIEEKP